MSGSAEDQIRPPTPPLDPGVAEIASRLHVARSSKDPNADSNLSDEDEDELLDELEKEDFDLDGFREQRVEALKAELAKAKDMRESDHGRLTEIFDEKAVIKASANEDRCIIHFYHRNFRRCQVMDKHLEILAPRHFKTRFIRVFVENVPWLVEKLQIKVLPCVICFIRGVSKDRLIGFEEIGNDDSFTTTALEIRLAQSGVIDAGLASGSREVNSGSRSSGIRGSNDTDDDYDWD